MAERMKITLSIPRLPQSGNKTRKFSGWERQAYRDLWHQEVQIAYLLWERSLPTMTISTPGIIQLGTSPLPYQKAKVTFTVFFKDKRRHDRINTAEGLKGALDGLVAAGIIEDDENYPKMKCDDYYVLRYDREHPRVEIEIEEIR